MRKYIYLLAVLLVAIYLMKGALATQYKYPIPQDVNNYPIQGAMGVPYEFESAVTTTSYASFATVPLTGNDAGRQYRSLCAYNPSTTIDVYLCLGSSSSCSTDMVKVPAGKGLCLDNIYYGPLNLITTVWAKLGSAGSVTPSVEIW